MQKKVLIVDDDQGLVAPLKEGLESIGYKVSVAYDGLQGVLQAHQAKPDAIILDYQMPGGGGRSVFERLRKAPDTAAIPIIFSSVVPPDEIRSKIKAGENTFFLRKPVGLRQFISVLNSVLGLSLGGPLESEFSPVMPPAGMRALPPVGAPAKAAAPGRPKAGKPRYHEFSVRVTYADTDKMGVIYYGNYFRYFEQGRVELLRSMGVRYRDLEVQRKLFIPVVETGCRYLAASRYDDLLVVRTCISDLGKASITFKYVIFDEDLGLKKVSDGFTRHAVVNDLWRAARIPEDLTRLLTPFVGDMSRLDGIEPKAHRM